MKTKLFAALMGLLTFTATSVQAAPKKERIEIRMTKDVTPENAARARVLQARLDSIQELDYEALSPEQQKEVKAEIKDIKAEVKKMDGVYIYLGGGVLLIIILLIILL